MFRGGRTFVGCLSSLAIASVGVLLTSAPAVHAASSSATVVVSEVYPGGGGSTGVYTHDFVEVHNKSASPVDIDGWTLRYRSSAGASWATSVTFSGSIAAGDYLVIQTGSAGTAGVAVPTPDYTGSSSVNLSASAGHVALVDSSVTTLACTTTCAADAAVQDLIGYGAAANGPAGTAAPAPTSNAESLQRNAASDNTVVNGDDFTSATPTPNAPAVDVDPPDPTAYTIEEIQGTAASSPHVGELVVTEGVVTAAYPAGGFNGFVIQTEGTGGLADLTGHTTSSGIAVSGAVPGTLAVGDFVSVEGTVQENFGLTRIAITGAAAVTELATPFDPVTPITAPWPATATERETIESMLYTPQGTLTVSETFPTNQFGEVGLATGTTPLMQPSDVGAPGSTEFDDAVTDNFARGITLDDGASTNYLSAANSSLIPPFIAADGSLRVGGTATILTNVIVDFQFGAWRFQPLGPLTAANDDSFATFASTRPATPDPVALGDGDIKLATFNVLNYFTTGGEAYEATHAGANCVPFSDRAGNPITVNNCGDGFNGPRGAWNAENLARQQAKTVAAINAMDADIVGLMEMENSANMGETADEATATLVAALNAAAGAGTWAFIPSSAEFPAQSLRDVITVAIIYKPAVVKPIGTARALGTESDAGEAFDNAREPLGQAFVHAGGGDPFFVAVNHFKSKGCDTTLPPSDPNSDQADGQSCFNADRVEQAEALTAWVDSVLPTYTPAITDAFLIGDFNSYTQEDPMQVFYGAGYVDLNDEHGNPKQSYNFDGLNGSLDHILANPSALARVTGSDIWNINAPESLALEYSRYNYHGQLYYTADPYRSSDHDPEVAAITASAAPAAGTTDITLVSINDFHGRIDANTVKWAGTVEQIVASAGGDEVAITGAGDLVSASLFASAVQDDQPTIDVMNAIGLDASAVGNHEFDKGWPDLRDRILGGDGDPDANAAHWDYLGANVYDATQLPALVPLLPEYSIIEINGIKIGVIGAVTEETPTLVSPAGMVGVSIGDPVEAVNRVADQLTDGNPLNGEADLLVATFHEGAPSGAQTLAQNMAASAVFTEIVNGVSPKVDVLFNGHTHQAYVYDAANPGGTATNGMRPVLQTGSYGDFVGKVVLTVNTTTKDLVSYTAENVARTAAADAALIAEYPSLVDVKTIVDNALAFAATVGNQPKGRVSNDISTAYTGGTFGPSGYQATRNNTNRDQRNAESTLGGLVANALAETLDPLGIDLPSDVATIGVVNPGGLRAELFYPTSMPLNEGDGVVTYAEANSVLPFVNNLWTTHLTGAQFKTLLEQQWQRDGSNNIPTRAYLQLGLSDNVSYTFDPALAEGSRITSITIDGQPVSPTATYKIATFSFLTAGGDNFRIFTQGTSAADSGLVDRDAWIAYLEDHATPPGIAPDYVRRSAAVTPVPTQVVQGGSLTTTLSYLDMTSLGTPENTSVDVILGGTMLGSAPITFTPAASGNAAPVVGTSGTAAVNLSVPEDTVSLGVQALTFIVQPSGKTITFSVTVTDGTAPAPPIITVPADGSTVGDPTPTIEGTAEPGVTVNVFDGLTPIGSTSPNGVGEWSLTPASALSEGLHSVTATATDGSSNTSAPSTAVAFTVDSFIPDPPEITSPEDGSITNDATPSISGTAEEGLTVEVFDGPTSLGTTPADGTGAWSLTPSTPLADGSHSLTATATDAASNTSPASTAVVFSIDATPPAAPVITSPGDGEVWPGDVALVFVGSGEPGTTIELTISSTSVGTALVGGDGTWHLAPSGFSPSPHVQYTVVATATDLAGNTGAPSGAVTFSVDEGLVALPDEPVGSLTPERILDTRPGGTTYDNQFAGIGIQTAGTTLQLTVGGRGGVPADAEGVVLNVTATDGTGVGYVTAWPCGFARPEASSLNFDASSAAPNAVLTAIGDDGKVCLYTAEASAHLIADVNGFVPAGSGYEPLNPARLADSRDGASTVDGEFLGGGPRTANSTWVIDIAGRGGIPADAETASLNITVTGGTGTGYVTVWPCDETQPTASSLNFQAGQSVPNAVISKLSPSGEICVFVAEAAAHVIVDANGYFPAGSGFGALNPARLLDTRDAPTTDGQFTNLGPRQPGEVLELTVAGRGGVPATATGVVLNVTSTNATGTGYVTMWPCTGPAPNVSTVNYVAGVTRANASIAKLSPTGKVCLVVTEASSDLIVDVTGYLGS